MTVIGRSRDALQQFLARTRSFQPAAVDRVLNFYVNYQGFRTADACAAVTGLPASECLAIRRRVERARRLGGYFFEAGAPPQKHMRRFLTGRLPWLSAQNLILEVGPGEFSVFPSGEYPNWYGVDKGYDGHEIDFRGIKWARGKYPPSRMLRGAWEHLAAAAEPTGHVGCFDLVVSSHSYEHVLEPIRALREAHNVLRPGGVFAAFVPDGYSDEPAARGEPTHTLYLTPPMITEFFTCAGGFERVVVESFRPNYDIVILATKCAP